MKTDFIYILYIQCNNIFNRSSSSLSEAETVEVDTSAARGVARSNPVNMPGVRPIVPVLIDSGSASSLEHSPSDSFRRKSLLSESGRAASLCDVQLKEDLAEAMKEDHASSNCGRFEGEPEELSSSSLSSASRASLDPPSPTPPASPSPPSSPSPSHSYSGDFVVHFPGDQHKFVNNY
ncbi:unnamed protein product [Diatraea saccharalis]|uniref:Uncharacterized protein n=1 Tax=Diatraea saccharalis TaxID=40085 RepID=A0A9N9WGE3_9NEOP|nr:unnamed protein product [Diatraea saccharalis]